MFVGDDVKNAFEIAWLELWNVVIYKDLSAEGDPELA